MFFLLALLAAAWEQIVTFKQPSALIEFGKKIREPGILNTLAEEKGMVAMDYTNVRPPFGGNVLAQRQVAEPSYFMNNEYQQSYQTNIRNVQIRTVEARLPEAGLMTDRNNFGSYSSHEIGFQKINDYWKSRRGQENRWLID